MPVDPRSDLPVRIAMEISKALGKTINPSELYAHDNNDLGAWKSQSRYDYDHEEDDQYIFNNRRVACFDLLHDPSGMRSSSIPLQIAFNEQQNMQVIARCAIHEVYESLEHNFEQKQAAVFDPEDLDRKRKVGIEITLDSEAPIQAISLPNGNFRIFQDSTGTAAQFSSDAMHYDSREHGTKLVEFATEYIGTSVRLSLLEFVP